MGTATTTGMALKDENYQLRAKVSELEEYIKQRGHAETESDLLTEIRELTGMSDHGNGELLLGWMDAHSKACDRADAAEAKLVEVENSAQADAIAMRVMLIQMGEEKGAAEEKVRGLEEVLGEIMVQAHDNPTVMAIHDNYKKEAGE